MSNHRLAAFDLDELKLVYRVLHAHLMEHLELMDAAIFQELQDWLQLVAAQQGIDVGDHAQWDAWLGGEHVPCEERMTGRVVLGVVEGGRGED